MSCDEILKTDIAKIGYTREFDDRHGKVVMIGGRDCWEEITQGVKDADEFMREKLGNLEARDYDLESMNLPTLDQYVEMVEKIPNYSDGMMLITGWEWKTDEVNAGQELAVCLH